MTNKITKGQLDNGFVSAWFSLMNLETPVAVPVVDDDLLKSTIRLVAVKLIDESSANVRTDTADRLADLVACTVTSSVRSNKKQLTYVARDVEYGVIFYSLYYNITNIIFSEYLRIADPSPDTTIRLR